MQKAENGAIKAPEKQPSIVPKNKASSQNSDSPKIWCVIGDMRYGSPETEAILEERAREWLEMHPPGAPRIMYKRMGGYRVAMKTDDVMYVFDTKVRTAQRLLNVVRFKIGKPKNSIVTVEEYCFIHKQPEETVRKKLAEKYG